MISPSLKSSSPGFRASNLKSALHFPFLIATSFVPIAGGAEAIEMLLPLTGGKVEGRVGGNVEADGGRDELN